MKWELLVTILVAIFSSQGFWTWLMNRSNQTKLILTEVRALRADFDQEKAITARARILRFNDELLNDTKHSKESFDQTLSDIDTYEAYCAANPKFLNSKTAMSVDHIKRIYQKCEDERTFI